MKNEFVQALLREIELQREFLGKETVHTIYLGGGTPSLLDPLELETILQQLYANFEVSKDAEITLEANPDDISDTLPLKWKSLGINRLSIGVQSFFNSDLSWMNRAHNASQALDAINRVQTAGINNITIDLIYGTPTLNDSNWIRNLDQAAALNIPHLSCYALTVEPKTALDLMIEKKKVTAPASEDQARQFTLLMDWARSNGYEHYEISNFAKPGYRSRHNSAYWQGKPYLGLGPSAHSFRGNQRQWNVANNALYIKSISNNTVPLELETLTGNQQLNEYIMTSSRTAEGLNLALIEGQFGAEAAREIELRAAPFQKLGQLTVINKRIQLTDEGKLFADGIAAELFVI